MVFQIRVWLVGPYGVVPCEARDLPGADLAEAKVQAENNFKDLQLMAERLQPLNITIRAVEVLESGKSVWRFPNISGQRERADTLSSSQDDEPIKADQH